MILKNELSPEKRKAIAGYVTKILVLGADFVCSLIAFLLALLIASKFNLADAQSMIGRAVLLLLVLRAAAFMFFKTHRLILRFIGERDYWNVFLAITASSALFWLLLHLYPSRIPPQEVLPVIIIDYLILLGMAISARILLRLILNQHKQQRNGRRNTAIFGAGEMGNMLLRVLQHNGSHDYRIVAFFDDNPKVHRKSLNGIEVFNPGEDFAKAIRKYGIKVAIIGINQLSEERRIEFIQACLEHKVQVLKVPPTEDWLNNSLNIGQLRDIRFEDLLNRPPIKLDEAGIKQSVHNKVVLVTGCAGSIGSEIIRQLLRYQPRLIIGLDQAETPLAEIGLALHHHVDNNLFLPILGDVKDYEYMHYLFEQYQPNYVFHAAAYKHVPVMERFPAEAVKVNVMGTQNIAGLSSRFNVEKFVMISTDKVVKPSNVMGASKRIAEIYIQSLNNHPNNNTQFITTRFGNVLGSNGSVIPIFKQQIENRQPVTVTDPNVTRFFMTIPEACQLVLEAGAMGNGGEIFIFDMGKPVRIVELAERMIQMAGLKPGKDIQIIFTGLRPGEKLNEELLDAEEGLIETHHSKIRKANVRHCNHYEVGKQIGRLIEIASSNEPAQELVKIMKQIVPEFTSQNSDFSALDTPPPHSLPSPSEGNRSDMT